MSRGLGKIQRDVLAQLEAGPLSIEELAGGIQGDGSYRTPRWESYRRAVTSLRRKGLVRRDVRYMKRQKNGDYRHRHYVFVWELGSEPPKPDPILELTELIGRLCRADAQGLSDNT